MPKKPSQSRFRRLVSEQLESRHLLNATAWQSGVPLEPEPFQQQVATLQTENAKPAVLLSARRLLREMAAVSASNMKPAESVLTGSTITSDFGSLSGSGQWWIEPAPHGFEPTSTLQDEYIDFWISFYDPDMQGGSVQWGTAEATIQPDESSQPATMGVDFEGASGTISVPSGVAGSTTKVRVKVLKDSLIEPQEWLLMSLSNPSPGTQLVVGDQLAHIENKSVDLDNDANNDGAIGEDDDPIEATPPSAYVYVNDDDDNENGVPDMNESGPIVGEDDLEPFKLNVGSSGYQVNPTGDGWLVVLTAPSGVNVWENADKTGPVVFDIFNGQKVWVYDEDVIPETLYVEKLSVGASNLHLAIYDSTGNPYDSDAVLFTAFVPEPVLDEAHLYGWEAQDFNFYVSASITHGSISRYEFDLNRDGFFDHLSVHDDRIDGAVEFDLELLHLLANGNENGEYPITVRVVTSAGTWTDFERGVTIGNMPPAITFGGDESGEPNQIVTLSFSTFDPGLDTVTQISVSWGDGTTDVISGGSGTLTHVFSADGKYTVLATAIDEDGSYQVAQDICIGDTDATAPETFEPQIISAIATILANGDGLLTIQAEGYDGSPILSYEYDLDGDGVFELVGGNTVQIAASGDFYPYSVNARITDSLGNAAYALFGFVAGGPVQPRATKNNYQQLFRAETPDLPDNWKIHHTKQQAIADRYWIEKGINVHENIHLRGVPKIVHDRISHAQILWWIKKGKELGVNSTVAKQIVPLDQVEAFEADLAGEFGEWWLEKGSGQSKKVTQIKNYFKKAGSQMRFATEQVRRLQRLGLGVLAAVPFLEIIASNAEAGWHAATFDPETHPEFLEFMAQYDMALTEAVESGQLSHNKALHVRDAFLAFGRSMKLDDSALNHIESAMGKYIDLNLSN